MEGVPTATPGLGGGLDEHATAAALHARTLSGVGLKGLARLRLRVVTSPSGGVEETIESRKCSKESDLLRLGVER